MADGERLVTIRQYWLLHEAQMARNALVARDVKAYLHASNFIQTAWPLGNAAGGVRLQVIEQDAELAEAILRECGVGRSAAETGVSGEIAEAEPMRFCPHCEAEAEPDFDTCWRCGRTYERAVLRRDRTGVDASDQTPKAARDVDSAPVESVDDVRQRAGRAWRLAVLGVVLFFLGPLAVVRSLRLIIEIGRAKTPLSTAVRIRLAAAYCLDVAVIGAWSVAAVVLFYAVFAG